MAIPSLPTLPTFLPGSKADVTGVWAIAGNLNSQERVGNKLYPAFLNVPQVDPDTPIEVTGAQAASTIPPTTLSTLVQGTQWFLSNITYNSTEWQTPGFNFFDYLSNPFVGQMCAGGGYIQSWGVPRNNGAGLWTPGIVDMTGNFDKTLPAPVQFNGFMESDQGFLFNALRIIPTQYKYTGDDTRRIFTSTFDTNQDGNQARGGTLQNFTIPSNLQSAIGFVLPNSVPADPFLPGLILHAFPDDPTNIGVFFHIEGQFSGTGDPYQPAIDDILDPQFVPVLSTNGFPASISFSAGSVESPVVNTTSLELQFMYASGVNGALEKIWRVPVTADIPIQIDNIFNRPPIALFSGPTPLWYSTFTAHAFVPVEKIIELYPSPNGAAKALFTGSPLLGSITNSWQNPLDSAATNGIEYPQPVAVLPYAGPIARVTNADGSVSRDPVMTVTVNSVRLQRSSGTNPGGGLFPDGLSIWLDFYHFMPHPSCIAFRIGF